jgi:hypothetical protein
MGLLVCVMVLLFTNLITWIFTVSAWSDSENKVRRETYDHARREEVRQIAHFLDPRRGDFTSMPEVEQALEYICEELRNERYPVAADVGKETAKRLPLAWIRKYNDMV